MTTFVSIILLIVNVITFAITVLFGMFGIYEQIMGPADAEKLLKKMHIPLNYNQTLIIGFICLALMISTYILRAKLSGKMWKFVIMVHWCTVKNNLTRQNENKKGMDMTSLAKATGINVIGSAVTIFKNRIRRAMGW